MGESWGIKHTFVTSTPKTIINNNFGIHTQLVPDNFDTQTSSSKNRRKSLGRTINSPLNHKRIVAAQVVLMR